MVGRWNVSGLMVFWIYRRFMATGSCLDDKIDYGRLARVMMWGISAESREFM